MRIEEVEEMVATTVIIVGLIEALIIEVEAEEIIQIKMNSIIKATKTKFRFLFRRLKYNKNLV